MEQLLANKKLHEGSVVVTDYQTAGQGQVNNHWESEPKSNLLCSIVLYPKNITTDTIFLLSKCISVAVHSTLQQFTSKDIKIKWPNDIIINHKKVAGILIKNTIVNNTVERTIVGIGINANQLQFGTHLPNAASLRGINNQFVDINKLEEILFYFIEKNYDFLNENRSSEIEQKYLNNLYKNNGEATFELDGEIIKSNLITVNNQGELNLVINGQHKKYSPKSIKQQLG
jgi:BirA family biotin operon repressor/biotin-[acetyl-CoA-carboxylase] ligase